MGVTPLSLSRNYFYRHFPRQAYRFTGKAQQDCKCAPSSPFKDFNAINWTSVGVDPDQSFVLFDDHQVVVGNARRAVRG